jgi:hypothetical protein
MHPKQLRSSRRRTQDTSVRKSIAEQGYKFVDFTGVRVCPPSFVDVEVGRNIEGVVEEVLRPIRDSDGQYLNDRKCRCPIAVLGRGATGCTSYANAAFDVTCFQESP